MITRLGVGCVKLTRQRMYGVFPAGTRNAWDRETLSSVECRLQWPSAPDAEAALSVSARGLDEDGEGSGEGARRADLRSLVVQSGLPYEVVRGLADRGQLYVAIRLANTPEGRERRRVDVGRQQRNLRRQVALIRDGATFSGHVALRICQDMARQGLDTRRGC